MSDLDKIFSERYPDKADEMNSITKENMRSICRAWFFEGAEVQQKKIDELKEAFKKPHEWQINQIKYEIAIELEAQYKKKIDELELDVKRMELILENCHLCRRKDKQHINKIENKLADAVKLLKKARGGIDLIPAPECSLELEDTIDDFLKPLEEKEGEI